MEVLIKLKRIKVKHLLIIMLLTIIALSISACDMGSSTTRDTTESEMLDEFNILVQEPGANLIENQSFFNLEGSRVILKDSDTFTNNKGVATFENIETGSQKLLVEKNGYEPFNAKLDVSQDSAYFKVDLIKENSAEINPEVVEYNKKDPADVETEIIWNEASEVTGLYRIVDEQNFEIKELGTGEEITLISSDNNNTLVIKESYLSGLAEKHEVIEIFVKFDQGSDALLKIEIVEEEILPTIAEIDVKDEVQDITVEYGTDREDAKTRLTDEISIKDSDQEEHRVTLDWSIEDYNDEIADDYLAKGTFDLPEGVTQTDPETLLEVTATVTVEEEVKKDAELNPRAFDFWLDDPQDIESKITWNEASEITGIKLEIQDNVYEIRQKFAGLDNTDTLVISKNDILAEDPQAGQVFNYIVSFDAGESSTIEVNILEEEKDDEEPEPGDITVSGTFDIEHNFPSSVVEANSMSDKTGELWEVASSDYTSFKEEKSNEIILRLSPEIDQEKAKTKAQDLGYNFLEYSGELNAMLVEIPGDMVQSQAISQASSEPGILSAQPNNVFTIMDYREPNDEYYYKQWAPSVMRLPQTWRDAQGSSNVRVAVLDTGIDYTHVEMDGMVDIDSGYNFSESNHDDENDFMDRHMHGTHVAGIIGAKANNGRGVVGVMWDVDLIPVKVLNDYGTSTEWRIAQGILYAAGLMEDAPIQQADIINMSLGMMSNETPELMEEAVNEAAREGVVIVAASGNTGDRNVAYPAKFDDVIAVGALAEADSSPPRLADYSSYGPEQDLVAPGSEIWSTTPNDYIHPMSGTSMAAPQVAGLAGLMIAEGIPHDKVLDVMIETAIDLGDSGYNERYGHGMINSYWGVHEATELNILVGERNGPDFDAVAEAKSSITSNSFTIDEVPEGEYEVMLWLDVRGNGIFENGDYFATTGKIELNQSNYNFDFTLKEYNQ